MVLCHISTFMKNLDIRILRSVLYMKNKVIGAGMHIQTSKLVQSFHFDI